tara:strand:- start:5404 stop:5685 length:282 start_codon:yes stop_codon:yes gene_type:complete
MSRKLELISDNTKWEDYALSALDDAIFDVINSEASEYDIYNTIMNSIRDRGRYHEGASSRCQKVLNMLEGEPFKNDPIAGKVDMGGPYNDESA